MHLWLLGMGGLLRRERPALGWLTLVFGFFMLINSLGSLLDNSTLSMIGFSGNLLILPLWAMWIGVDLFFVISGFIMVWVAGALPRGTASARDFMFARVTRIYPLWWLFAGAMALFLLYFKGVPWDPERLDPKELDGAVHLIKSLFLWPQPTHPVLGVGWTLVHEMYFYVGFALLLLCVPLRWRLRALLAWGAIVLIGAMAGLGTAFGRNLVELVFAGG